MNSYTDANPVSERPTYAVPLTSEQVTYLRDLVLGQVTVANNPDMVDDLLDQLPL